MLKKLTPTGLHPDYWRGMVQEIKLVWQVLWDRRTPFYLKAFPFLVALYLLSPLDLMPEFIPVLGQLDDAGLILLAVKTFLRLVPEDIVAEHMQSMTLLPAAE